MIRPWMLTLLGSALAIPALAQSPNASPLGTPTRGMVMFSALEKELGTAVGSGRLQDVDRLLASDFEQRDAVTPDRPLPRAEWLKGHPYQQSSPAISHMTVHDYGSLAVVSFIASGLRSSDTARPTFVVDVWRSEAGSWQLKVRYRSQTAVPTETQDQRPSGKE
ncbi:MAG: hypothetical protein JWL98_1325 [Xanthomonadaceae bacterium]|nr:hypothetical protein [Xanthomonadaceae bacterium]